MDGLAIGQYIMSTSLHQEIHRITDTEEHAKEFLFQRGILKATMSCPGYSSVEYRIFSGRLFYE